MTTEAKEFIDGLITKYEQFPAELEGLMEKIYIGLDKGIISQEESVSLWHRLLTILGNGDNS